MKLNLVIVESATKAKSIKTYLNKSEKLKHLGRFHVMASQGHILDLAKNNKAINTDNFYCKFEKIKAKERVIKSLEESIQDAKDVYLATDNDREGEGIAWHIKDYFKLRQYHRIVFNEITEKAVVNAVINATDIDLNRVNAYLSRRILDRLIGFNLTELLWKSFSSNVKLSAGRVQSAILNILCERETDIKNFDTSRYWSFHAQFHEFGEIEFTLYDKKHVHKLCDATDTQVLLKSMVTGDDCVFTMNQVEINDSKTKSAPAPFITSSLQQTAYNELHFPVKKTMTVAQELYENGLITYMRTDSTYINPDVENNIKQHIKNEYGNNYVKTKGKSSKTKAMHAQEAHEAIRPSDVYKSFLEKDEHSADQVKLYELIFKRTTAFYMTSAVYDDVKLSVVNSKLDPSIHQFVSKKKFLKFDGWLKIYNTPLDTPTATEFLNQLRLNDHVSFTATRLYASCTWTHGPAHFDEASLVHTLESVGIGRPSTYATMIEKLFTKQYVRKGGNAGKEREYTHFEVDFSKKKNIKTILEKKLHGEETTNHIVIQKIGEVVNDFVKQRFPFISSTQFTSDMEQDLDKVSNGQLEYGLYLKIFYKDTFEPTYRNLLKEIENKSSASKNNKHKAELAKHERTLTSSEIHEKIGGDGNTCVVRIAKHGPVIEIKNKDSAVKSRFISLTPYLKDSRKSIDDITTKDIEVLLSMPVSMTYKQRNFELCYGMHGFYFKGQRLRLRDIHMKMIVNRKYDDLVKSLFT